MRAIFDGDEIEMATPRTPLPKAALYEVGEALGQLNTAKSQLKGLLKFQNAEVASAAGLALNEINEAIMHLIEARTATKEAE